MSMERHNPVLAMFASADVMMAPDKRDWLVTCIDGLSRHPDFDKMMVGDTASNDEDGFWPEPDSWRAALRPYAVKDGILHIPVKGMLLHDFPWSAGNWATGYDYIWRAFERGCRDFKAGNIKGIALIVNSGGGLVAGCWDAVDKMNAAKKACGVPVRAFAHEHAYSAAYGVTTVADTTTVSRTGGVGSIGTLRTHVDWSKFNERMGLTYTFIQAGEFKTDGHPDKPLSDSAQARWQEQITELNEIFIAAVAQSRGLEPQAVRDFEAATFSASQALSNGLADVIGTLDDALVAFAADLSSSEGTEQMSQDTAAQQAAIDQAVAAANTAAAAAQATAVATARTEERTRVAAIMGCDEAKGRESLANHIAMNTDMDLEAAKQMLAAAPAAAAAPVQDEQEDGATGFAGAMERTDNPNVGSTKPKKDGEQAADDGSDVVALVQAAGLKGFRAPEKN